MANGQAKLLCLPFLNDRYRIGPFEVESALIEHPAVLESAVVSSPDPVRGEVILTVLVHIGMTYMYTINWGGGCVQIFMFYSRMVYLSFSIFFLILRIDAYKNKLTQFFLPWNF